MTATGPAPEYAARLRAARMDFSEGGVVFGSMGFRLLALLLCLMAALDACVSAQASPTKDAGGPWTLTALPSIGTVTWRCQPNRSGVRYGLGFNAFTNSATDRLALRANGHTITARLVQPGERISLPYSRLQQQLVISQSTEPGTLRAVVDVDFRPRPISPSHCFSYLPPRLTVQLTPR